MKALVLWNNLVYFLLLLGTFLLIGCPSRLHLEQSESWAFGLGITCTYSKPFELWTCLIWTSAILTVWNSPTFMLGNYGATFVTAECHQFLNHSRREHAHGWSSLAPTTPNGSLLFLLCFPFQNGVLKKHYVSYSVSTIHWRTFYYACWYILCFYLHSVWFFFNFFLRINIVSNWK